MFSHLFDASFSHLCILLTLTYFQTLHLINVCEFVIVLYFLLENVCIYIIAQNIWMNTLNDMCLKHCMMKFPKTPFGPCFYVYTIFQI